MTPDFRLGEWLVKPMSNALVGDAGEVRVEPKVMDLLVHLARQPGDVIPRRKLLDAVWDRVVINEEALTRAMSELRAALGDTSPSRRYILTVPERGYQLVAPVDKLVGTIPPEPARTPTVAVLPFTDHSPAVGNAYFGDGLTEELTVALSQVHGLHVAGSISSFALREQQGDIRQTGAALGVENLLIGSVRREGDRLRISTQLVRVANGFQVWAQTFDRVFEDIFAIQEEIAQSVVEALKVELGIEPLVTSRTDNLRAYELYLKGKLKYQEQIGMSYRGIAELEEAVSIAPDFPEAQGLYAYIMSMNTISEPYSHNADNIRLAYEACLALNPFQEEALMAKAIAVRWQTWDWAAVEGMFQKSLATAPNCPHVLAQFASRYYRDTCQFAEAQALLERAVKLDPISAGARASLSYVLRYQRRYDDALTEADHALRIDPNHGYALLAKVMGLLSVDGFAQVEETLHHIEATLGGDDMLVLNCRARFHAHVGDEQKMARDRDRAIMLSKAPGGDKYLPIPGWLGMIVGDVDEAVHWLGAALDRQISQVLNTRAYAMTLDGGSMLAESKLQAFLARMNLDDAAIAQLHRRCQD